MLIAEYGDRIDEAVNTRVHLAARALGRLAPAGVVEVVPTYRSLAVHFDPLRIDGADLRALLTDLDAHQDDPDLKDARTIEVPVVYGGAFGPDLPDVAAHAGLREDEVVAIHAAGSYRVYMMGFTPGFPYLGGMSPRIATPRLPTPRVLVPAGSVGIAAQQTGIYPTASPGGWRLIGRTPIRLFDPFREVPALCDAGDTIRFVPVAPSEFETVAPMPPAAAPASLAETIVDGFEVLDGGMLTTVQDLGRAGFQRIGVPAAGAMDAFALRAANRLVGNDDNDAGLEMTFTGPELRTLRDALIAVTGGDLQPRLNGRPLHQGRPIVVRRGDILSWAGRRMGLRAYLAIQGGVAVPPVLGSRSTYRVSAFGGFNGRELREGDVVPLFSGAGVPQRGARRAPAAALASPGQDRVVRVVLGPQHEAFTEAGLRTLLTAPFVLGARSDRVGCRLEGPAVEHRCGADIVSDATAFGSVQISGDGMPIVLMADRGTTGGYTKIATVISADLSRLAQAIPGDTVRFAAVSTEDAIELVREQEAQLAAVSAPLTPAPDLPDDDVFDEDRGAGWAAASDPLAEALGDDRRVHRGTVPGVRAGMTGLVVEVLVAPGQAVSDRQSLVVIEAMKMQSPVRSPRAGIVCRVRVRPGDHVAADTLLVEYEG